MLVFTIPNKKYTLYSFDCLFLKQMTLNEQSAELTDRPRNVATVEGVQIRGT